MKKIEKSFEGVQIAPTEKGYEAIVSTFAIKDSYGDRIEFGAFAESIANTKAKGGSIPVLFQHENDLFMVVGRTLDIMELEPGDERLPMQSKTFGGLYVEFEFYEQFEEGRKAKQLLDDKVYNEFSVGMYVKDYEVVNESFDDFEAIIRKADLVEYSMVLRGANPLTGLKQKDVVYSIKEGREISQSNLNTLNNVATKLDEASAEIKTITSKFEKQEIDELRQKRLQRERVARIRAKRNNIYMKGIV